MGSGQHVIFQSYAVVVRVGLKISMEGFNLSKKLKVTAEKGQSYIGFGLEGQRSLTLEARISQKLQDPGI